MSNTPPDHAAASAPRSSAANKRMLVGLICFGLGLLLVAGAVVFVILSLVDANPIGLIPGILVALVGIALNFAGLVLLYRALTRSALKNNGGSGGTP